MNRNNVFPSDRTEKSVNERKKISASIVYSIKL